MTEEHQTQNEPHISVNAQYIKDLSFENPSAPSSLSPSQEKPKVELALDLHISKLEDSPNIYEVALLINVKTVVDDQPLFIVELEYAGVFSLLNFEEEDHKTVLAIHCPAMLFPFARRIVANVTQDGGYQPLMIDPVDFGALYSRKMADEANQEEKATKN